MYAVPNTLPDISDVLKRVDRLDKRISQLRYHKVWNSQYIKFYILSNNKEFNPQTLHSPNHFQSASNLMQYNKLLLPIQPPLEP